MNDEKDKSMEEENLSSSQMPDFAESGDFQSAFAANSEQEENIGKELSSVIRPGRKASVNDSVKQYIAHVSQIQPVDREQMGELWKRVKRGDRRAKEKIFEQNLRLVISIARKFMDKHNDGGLDFLDLIEEGNLGLYHAIEKYDPELGYRFSTYANYWIEQHVRRYLEETSKTIRIPPHAWTAMRKWQREYKALQEKLGRSPEFSEMTRHLGWTETQARLAIRTSDLVSGISSIDATRTNSEGKENTLEETIHSGMEDTPEHKVTENNTLEVLKKAFEELDPREREILEARYGLHDESAKTLNEIGKELHLSRERVRQLEARALQTLRRAVISLGLNEDAYRTASLRKKSSSSNFEMLSMALAGKKQKRGSSLKILKIPRRNK